MIPSIIGVPDWLSNPWAWLVRQEQDLLNGLVTVFEQVIIHPARPQPASWQDYLYGNALGLAGLIAYVVLIVVLVVSLFHHGAITNVLHAFMAFLFIALVGSVFFSWIDQINALGDDLAATAMLIYQSGSHANGMLDVTPPATTLGNLVTLTPVVVLAAFDAAIAEYYQVVVIIFKLMILIAIAIRSLGKWGRRLCNFTIATGVVSVLLGRASMIAIIQTGKLVATHLPANGLPFVYNTILIGSLLAAYIVQFVLLFIAYNAVSSVNGKIDARVRGTVTAARKRMFDQTRPSPQAVYNQSYVTRRRHMTVPRATVKHSVNFGATKVVSKAAASVHPAAPAILVAAKVVRDLTK